MIWADKLFNETKQSALSTHLSGTGNLKLPVSINCIDCTS